METYKKWLISVLIGIFITLALFELAWSSVEGRWDILDETIMKVTIKKHGSQKMAIDFFSEAVFNVDGSFQMADFEGIWHQEGRKFTVNLDPHNLESFFQESLIDIFGWTADVDLKKVFLTGKEMSDGTIKGKLAIKMTIYVQDLGSEGRIKVSSKFTGTRIIKIINSENLAYQHLEEIMDKYHKTFDVYTDLSSAGNHFVTLGRMNSMGDEEEVEINPNYRKGCYSGDSCIENRFQSTGDNWGGWYFMNGILEGDEIVPKLNWGNYCDAGFDLTGATELTFWAKGEKGGERVEFFAFGVGRDAKTDFPLESCPDSSGKVSLDYITLSNNWTKYTIDLTGIDLSYILGGFGWVTSSLENNNQDITFYLDEIKYDKSHLDESRFLVSYETISSSSDFDTVMRNIAFTYDNALVLIAFIARGAEGDMERAELLADAFVYAINHDRYFTDGRLRNAYQGGDLILFPGWTPNGKTDTVRMPGWWDQTAEIWYEDRFTVSTHTGNLAWVMISLLSYYEETGEDQNCINNKHCDAALTLGNWIEANTKDNRGAGGYTGGYEGWEMTNNNPDGQTKLLWKSTEHNIDVYVAFARLYEATGDPVWKQRALHAKSFVEAMWDEGQGHFWTGTLNDGETINTDAIPADVNTWGLMALGNITKYERGIDWVKNNCYVEADGFKGFDFNDDRDHVWFEGTAHIALVYQILEDESGASVLLSELRRAQSEAPNSNGKGMVAASYDRLTTGFDWLYFNRLHIGATAWFIFAERGYNPYWNIKATDPIPEYKIEPVNYTLTITKEGSGSGIVTSSPSGINCGSDCNQSYSSGTSITLTATADSGSTFTDWQGCDSASDNICYMVMNTNKMVIAKFSQSPLNYVLNVNINPSGGGTVTGAGINCSGTCSYSYSSGTNITLTASANSGYTFSGWSGCDSISGTTCYVTMNANKTVTANFSASSREISYVYGDFILTNVCTYENNWCGYADQPSKAVIYGEMSKDIFLSSSYDNLDVTIFIPCNGWGEGLAGPDGSSAHIIVDDIIKVEEIDSTMPYHHGGYFKYEYCDNFTNTFNITGKNKVRLTIRMNDGARMDFQEARLKFY